MSQPLALHTQDRPSILGEMKCAFDSILRLVHDVRVWSEQRPAKAGTDHFRALNHSIINFIVHFEFQPKKRNKQRGKVEKENEREEEQEGKTAYIQRCKHSSSAYARAKSTQRKVEKVTAYGPRMCVCVRAARVSFVLFIFFTYTSNEAQYFNQDVYKYSKRF